MTTHSSILAWEIPWTMEPGWLQSMGSQKVRHDLATEHTQKHRNDEQNQYLFFKIALLKYNSHTIEFTDSKGAGQCFSCILSVVQRLPQADFSIFLSPSAPQQLLGNQPQADGYQTTTNLLPFSLQCSYQKTFQKEKPRSSGVTGTFYQMFKKEDLSFINFPEKENLRGRFPTYCTKASITLIAKPDRDITRNANSPCKLYDLTGSFCITPSRELNLQPKARKLAMKNK